MKKLAATLAVVALLFSARSAKADFLDDLLDSVTGGIHIQGGLEFLLTDRIRIHGGSRVGLVGNDRFLEFNGGLTFLWGELLSGEFR